MMAPQPAVATSAQAACSMGHKPCPSLARSNWGQAAAVAPPVGVVR